MGLKQNTWKLNQWYDQNVAGNAGYAAFAKGGMWSWGDSYRGELGQNNSQPGGKRSSPIQIGSDTDWVDIANTTNNQGAAINTDGELWMWGINGGGGLGQNDTTARSSPVQVPGTTWASKSDEEFGSDRSKFHLGGNSLAIKTDGTMWGWGYNQNGNLVQNSQINYSSPVQIPGTTWKYVSGNEGQNQGAIKTDGTLWMWGAGNGGRLANNTDSPTKYSSPVQVPGTTWRSISMANVSVHATKTDGTLWCWGTNAGGCLGQNQAYAQLNGASSPIQIGGGTDWKQAIAGPGDWSAAVKTDGTLWIWGRNENGLLGLNQAHDIHISSPTQVPGTTWKNAECFSIGMFGTKTDGTLWSWGYNGPSGVLGKAFALPGHRSSPVQIPGTTWKRVAGTKYAFVYATKS
jgi:alpha-tubulin suppressor-like RCC1 family protein